MIAVNGVKKTYVGCKLAEKTDEVKQILQERAEKIGLLSEKLTPYAGEDLVFMTVR